MSAYVLLLVAIVAEVVATSALKVSDGFTRLLPSIVVVVGYAITFYLLTLVLRRLDLGFVYATWSGLGTVGVAVLGVLFFGDSMTFTRVVGIALVIIGVIVLNIGGGA
jgi:small multidrug resistance pump